MRYMSLKANPDTVLIRYIYVVPLLGRITLRTLNLSFNIANKTPSNALLTSYLIKKLESWSL